MIFVSKFIYFIDVNNSIEYFCESAPMVSDPPSIACGSSLGVMVQRLKDEWEPVAVKIRRLLSSVNQ